jgi:hypothetical protein
MMDVDSYILWQKEMLEEELQEEYQQFENVNQRSYNPELDSDTEAGRTIQETYLKFDEMDDLKYRYENHVIPIQKRIDKSKPNIKFLKRQIAKHQGKDVSRWMEHIVNLLEKGFKIYDYVSESFKEFDDMYDECSLLPTSAFGYVFDGDSSYITDMDQAYNENVNNSLILPFCIHTTICPDRGVIYTSPNVPLGSWIKKIFSFSFTNLRYEIDG